MNSSKLANWSEILSSVAILVTLVFLLVETRQNTQAMETSSSQAALEAEAQFLLNAVEYPGSVLSWTRDDLSDEEVVRHYFSLMSFTRGREAMWAQYRAGGMDQETWERYSRPIPLVFQYAANRAWWVNQGRATFDPDFVTEVDAIIARTPLNDSDVASMLRSRFEER